MNGHSQEEVSQCGRPVCIHSRYERPIYSHVGVPGTFCDFSFKEITNSRTEFGQW